MISNPGKFFDGIRQLFNPKMSIADVVGINNILNAVDGWPRAWQAYAFATVYLETAHTMQPINEYGSDAYFFRMYDPKGNHPQVAAQLGNTLVGDGVKFHGRGYVQLTGRRNYTLADTVLGLKGQLLSNPELALVAPTAAVIMRHGMEEGWFSGRKLSEYLPVATDATFEAFTLARHVINGIDRASLIAGYASEFQNAIRLGS